MCLHPSYAAFKWTRSDYQMILCTDHALAFGGGGAGFGLCINAGLDMGTSAPCATFGNPCIAGDTVFKVIALEVWGFDRFR